MEPMRILVVDDEEAIRCLMSNVLRSAGYSVECAGSGREALAKLEAPGPDLVTVDIMMPDITGWELIEKLRSRADAPMVVVVTGRPDVENHPLVSFVAGVVRKPFMPRELLDVC